MTIRTFTKDFRRGLGSAIIELKNNPERDKYQDIVMRSCLKDIAYDTQVEGTKGYYLYTAIKMFTNYDFFLDKISEKFNKKLYWRLSDQLFDILCCFSCDGYIIAGEALENKYKWLKKHLPIMKNYNHYYGERELFQRLMRRKLDSGLNGFKQCINDMGEMIIKCGNDGCLWYDCFLFEAESEIGKDIFTYLENSEEEKVTAFYHAYKLNKKQEFERNTYKNSKTEAVTIEQLINRAHELAATNNPFRIFPLSRYFAKHASINELKMLAEIALQEPSDLIKSSLLLTFRDVDFPFDIELLFQYVFSNNMFLREAVIWVFSRIKDRRIHAFVPQLFRNNNVEDALSLLESNFEIGDETLIRKYIICSKRITHKMIISIINIYKNNKSKSCSDILLHFYKNTECTHCRCDIVETMIKNNVISQSILEECNYDSYKETRKLVENIGI